MPSNKHGVQTLVASVPASSLKSHWPKCQKPRDAWTPLQVRPCRQSFSFGEEWYFASEGLSFYDADLIETCKTENTEAVGYIDDVSILGMGPTAQRNCKTLESSHRKAERWAQQHGSEFAPVKYGLVHLTRDPRVSTSQPLRLPHATTQASPLCRYLGVEMEAGLLGPSPREKIKAKATQRLSALSALASSTWGTGLVNLRQAYRAMIVPQMLYGYLAWHIPGGKSQGRGSAMLNTITRIQRRAAQITTGPFRTTAGTAADVEAHLLPPTQQLEQTASDAIMRIHTTTLHADMAQTCSNKETLSPSNWFSNILEEKYGIHSASLSSGNDRWCRHGGHRRTLASMQFRSRESSSTMPSTL